MLLIAVMLSVAIGLQLTGGMFVSGDSTTKTGAMGNDQGSGIKKMNNEW
jgi:hypothetical protein